MARVARLILPEKMLVYLAIIDENIGHWLDKGRYLSENNYDSLFCRVLILLGGLNLGLGLALGLLAGYFIRKKAKKLRKGVLISIAFAVFLTGLLFLENRLEIVSAPNMLGILLVYFIGFSSFLVAYFSFVSKN